jgi:hypothetical protein
MPFLFPAAEPVAAKEHSAAASHARGSTYTFFESSNSGYYFEGGSRGVLALDRPVEHRHFFVIHDFVPVRRTDAFCEPVRIKSRGTDNAENFSTVGIQRDQRPGFILKGILGGFLKTYLD